MGKRGPQKTPTKLTLLRGNPGKRALPKREPQFAAPTSIEPPAFLSDEARTEWMRIVPILLANGLYTDAYRAALAGYCSSCATFQRAERMIREVGDLTKQGPQIIPNPYINIRDKALSQMTRYLREFGFSPASATGLSVSPQAENDELTKWRKSKA